MLRKWWIAIALGVVVPTLFGLYALVLLRERRDLLTEAALADVQRAAVRVAALVVGRAKDIQGDLGVAGIVLKESLASDRQTKELVRTQLVALDRAHRHYLKFWYVEGESVILTTSGNRKKPRPVPSIATETVLKITRKARETSGEIVRARAVGAGQSQHEFLRIFAFAPPGSEHVLAALVSLDTLFETLQARAQLPGTQLWVSDDDGTLLVDPGESVHAKDIGRTLRGNAPMGERLLGGELLLFPLARSAAAPTWLVWKSHEGRTLRWTTGVTLTLAREQEELRTMALELCFVTLGLFILGLTIAGFFLWQHKRQVGLDEKLSTMREVNRLREHLVRAEKLSAVGQIAAEMAHEIGTPLGVVSIRLDQLREELTSEKSRSQIEVMKAQIERISKSMRQLLDYSRPTQEERMRVNVRHAVEQTILLVEYRFVRAGITLRSDVQDGLCIDVSGDEFHQVLLNLLINAADACENGDSVTINASKEGNDIHIQVIDTGPGISDEIRNHIYEPFVSSKGPGQGTGLGLNIVKRIVLAHDGVIEFSSTQEGTTFSVRWPRADPSENKDSST